MFQHSDLQLKQQRIQEALDQLSTVLREADSDSLYSDLLQHHDQIQERLTAANWPSESDSIGPTNNIENPSAQRMFNTWTRFINDGEINDEIPHMIAASWKRCYPRINPIQEINSVRLNQAHLLSSQVASFDLISISRPIIEDVYQYIEKSGVAIILVNSAGCTLDHIGSSETVHWLDRWGITTGSILSEELLGTNAVGLALAERTAAEVIGPEHYLYSLHQIAGVAAPMFDLSGRLLGVLSLWMPLDQYHMSYLALVAASARAIEGQLQSDVLLAEQNSQLAQLNTILSTISDGILVWNAQRVLLHANQAASKILDTPVGALLGHSVDTLFTFPPFLYEAIDQYKPLSDVEVTITDGPRSITCMVNLDFVFKKNELQWIIVTLRSEKQERRATPSWLGTNTPLALEDIPGESHQIQHVRNFARSAARARASVLIRGETGTGKNTLANTIHNISPRREGPFFTIACSSLPPELIRRELLKYDEALNARRPIIRPNRLALAQGGTIFLQDVDALPLDIQAILMNYIDSRKIAPVAGQRSIDIDVRVIASTQVDIEKMVSEGRFRADLFYWLSTLMVTLPPLRERPRDVLIIADQILKRLAIQWGSPQLTLEPAVIGIFKKYSWPGNIRELEAVLGRATAQLGNGTVITIGMLPASVRYAVQPTPISEPSPAPIQSMLDIERQTIIRTAQLCSGNVSLMSRSLKVSRTTLWRRMREFGIYSKDYRPGSREAR